MRRLVVATASLMAMLAVSLAPAFAEQSRIALVIANSAYQSAAPLSTTAADAALTVETLKAAGYDVIEATDVTKANIGDGIRTLLDKVTAAGPQAVAIVYFAGYAAQFNNENYLVPVDAQIANPESLATETLPLSAITSALAAVPAAARIIVLDAARDHGFGKAAGQPVSPGLALIGAPAGMLIAYSAAPGAVAPDGPGPYSPFATALNTVARQPGLDIEQIFKGVRLEVNQASNGTQVPYMVSGLNVEVKLFDAPAAPTPTAAMPAAQAPLAQATAPQTLAPALGVANVKVPPRRHRRVTRGSMRGMSDDDAYRYAIEQDSLETYQWFVEDHPHYSLASQIWNVITGRRQDILWRRAQAFGTRDAYWNYLRRYPSGTHGWEARNWLAERGQVLPPSDYVPHFEPLPAGYYDEAIGLQEVVPSGFVRPPSVFDNLAPVFVARPRSQPVQPVVINIQSPPTPPANPTPVPVVAKLDPAIPQQPVSPISNPAVVPPTNMTGDPQQQKMMQELQQRLTNLQQKPTYRPRTNAELSKLLDDLDKVQDPKAEQMRQEVLRQLNAKTTPAAQQAAHALGPDTPAVRIPQGSKRIIQGSVDIVD
jgi:hypothetical protein